MKLDNVKIGKGFKICIFINIIFIVLCLIGVLFSFKVYNSSIFNIVLIFIYLLTDITFILSTIFCFCDYRNDKLVRKKNIKIWSIFLLAMIFIALILIVRNSLSIKAKERKEKMFRNDIINVLKEIEKTSEYKVYLYDDLINIDSSIKNKYSKGSYIENYKGKLYVCFSDDGYILQGDSDIIPNLELKKIGKFRQGCSFKFATTNGYNAGEAYLKEYIKNKYGIKVLYVETKENCSLFSCSEPDYAVATTLGEFNAHLTVDNYKIVEKDGYDEFVSNLSFEEQTILKIEKFILDIDENKNFYNVHLEKEHNMIFIYSNVDKAHSLEFADKIKNFLNNIDGNINIAVTKYSYNDDKKLEPEYIIGILKNDGKVIIKER